MLHCPYCGASLIRVNHENGMISWICATYLHKGKSTCIGMRIKEEILQVLTECKIIDEPVVVEEVSNDQNSKDKSQKDYRLIPVSEYPGDWKKGQ